MTHTHAHVHVWPFSHVACACMTWIRIALPAGVSPPTTTGRRENSHGSPPSAIIGRTRLASSRSNPLSTFRQRLLRYTFDYADHLHRPPPTQTTCLHKPPAQTTHTDRLFRPPAQTTNASTNPTHAVCCLRLSSSSALCSSRQVLGFW